jgi:hypothetical protein
MRRALLFSFLAVVLPSMAFASSSACRPCSGDDLILTGNGPKTIPQGLLFSGVFSGPASWTLISLPDGTHTYKLTGVISGNISSGFNTSDAKLELRIDAGKGLSDASPTVSSGDTSIAVPELGTLGLLGTGLVGIAGLLRRRHR